MRVMRSNRSSIGVSRICRFLRVSSRSASSFVSGAEVICSSSSSIREINRTHESCPDIDTPGNFNGSAGKELHPTFGADQFIVGKLWLACQIADDQRFCSFDGGVTQRPAPRQFRYKVTVCCLKSFFIECRSSSGRAPTETAIRQWVLSAPYPLRYHYATNPKAIILSSALFPQFIDFSEPFLLQFLILVATLMMSFFLCLLS
jgi:hypothetical protein